jgi:tetratricopeptide (TPR) repeat protein
LSFRFAAIALVSALLHAQQDDAAKGLARGIALQQKGDVAGAIAQYQLVLKRYPRSADAHNWLGVAYMQANRLVDATAAFRQAIRLKPDFVRAHNNLGSTLAQAGDFQKGVEAFRAGLKYAPDDLLLRLNLGTALRNVGDSAGAAEHFAFALQRDPGNPEVHHQLGQTLRQQGDLAGAVREFETALDLNPEYPDSYYILGQTLRQMGAKSKPDPEVDRARELARKGDFRAGIDMLRAVLARNPEDADARYTLGAALWFSGAKADALPELDAAVRLNPASADAAHLRAIAHRQASEFHEARRLLQHAIAIDPKSPAAYFDLGIVFLLLQRRAHAIGQFEAGLNLPTAAPPDLGEAIAALRSSEPDAEGHNILGRMLGMAGAPPGEVIAAFESAIRLRPDYAEAHNSLGLVYTQLNQDEKAAAAYREAIRLRPDYAAAHGNLGALLTTTDPPQAVKELEKAVSLQPGLLKAQYNLALAYGGDKEIAQLRKLLAANPGYPRADFSLGKALLRKGVVKEAIAHLELAVKQEPSFGDAHYQLGLALTRAGRGDEAAAAMRKGRDLIAAAERQQQAALDLNEGDAAAAKGDYQTALDRFRRAAAQLPDSPAIQQRVAALGRTHLDALIRDGRFAEAEPRALEFAKRNPKSSWGWYALGYTYYAQRKVGPSIEALSKSLSLDLTNAEAHKVLGRALMLIGRFDAARVEFLQGAKYNPQSAEMHYNLGKLYSIQDLWPEARRSFEQALKLDAGFAEAHDGLGFALESLGDDDAAIASYERAAKINGERGGTFAAPHVNLSALYNRAGKVDLALEQARTAVKVNPKSDRGWFQAAKAHEKREELDAALDALNKAIAIQPQTSTYHYVLAGIYRRLGRQRESAGALAEFRRLDTEMNRLEEKRREGLRDEGALRE